MTSGDVGREAISAVAHRRSRLSSSGARQVRMKLSKSHHHRSFGRQEYFDQTG